MHCQHRHMKATICAGAMFWRLVITNSRQLQISRSAVISHRQATVLLEKPFFVAFACGIWLEWQNSSFATCTSDATLRRCNSAFMQAAAASLETLYSAQCPRSVCSRTFKLKL